MRDYMVYPCFLGSDQNKRLLEYAVIQQQSFVGSTTATQQREYRKSSVLHHFPEWSDFFKNEVKSVLFNVFQHLSLPVFQPEMIECQITANNDGDYYRIHNDNGSSEAATRVLTYVYYFHREPKAFSGGQLKLYTRQGEQLIEPENNSIVLFRSDLMHEVLPVSCPSRAFADSRFTVNGWARH